MLMVVNDLNCVTNKMTKLNKIDKTYDLFEHKNKIRTYLRKT